MFAVIKTGGKQYRVATEDVLKIEKIAGETGDFVELSNVLMVGSADETTFGVPFVEGAAVSAEIVEQGRARKVIAFKKRRRQNSRRTIGHRQNLTTVRIAEILTDGKKPSNKAATKKESQPEANKKSEVPKGTPEKEEAAAAAPLFIAPEGDPDNLTDIKGIGPVAQQQLNEQGIMTFAQIAALSEADIAKVDEYMPFSADQISDWQEQAKELTN